MIPRAKNDRPPSVWQRRRMRIASENAARAARKRDLQEARARRADEEDEEEDERPQRRPGATARRPASIARRGGSKPSAVITRTRLKSQRSVIERVMAWLVLLVSFLGSIAMLHGGFGPLVRSIVDRQPNQAALIGGVLIQLLLTFLEWYYFDIPLIAWGARIADTATTAIGYGPLFLASLITLLYNRGIEQPLLPAWGVIVLVSLGIAWFPESRLVD